MREEGKRRGKEKGGGGRREERGGGGGTSEGKNEEYAYIHSGVPHTVAKLANGYYILLFGY